MSQSYTGISFPFRIGVKGGVVMSTTSTQDIPHIIESVEQILRTRPFERVMEYHINSAVSTYVFDPNDESTRALIALECQEAIEQCDERVEVVRVEPYSYDGAIYVEVAIKVKKYEQTYSVNVKVGEL